MRALLGALISILAACAEHDDAGPSRARCLELRERIVDLRLVGLPAADVSLHRQALVDALGERFVEQCRQLTAAEAACAFAAKDSTSVAACSRSR